VRSKIIATLGPASDNEAAIRELFAAGARIFRLNFSHGNAGDFGPVVRAVRHVEASVGERATLLMDLGGPKIRIGEVRDSPLELGAGDLVLVGPSSERTSDSPYLPLDAAGVLEGLAPGDAVALSDGGIRFTVEERRAGRSFVLSADNPGVVTSGKGVAFPGKDLPLGALTDKDMADLDDGMALGLDAVAVSFVSGAEDVRRVKKRIEESGRKAPVVAKIERSGAVERSAEIIEASDAVMVARGDLGLEYPLERLPGIQKELIRACNQVAKPVIVATQMLLSMVKNPQPTRAETTDVANAVLDGADCLMLSEETAVGEYPAESVSFMAKIAAEAEKIASAGRSGPLEPPDSNDPAWYLAYAACRLAENCNAAAVIAHTESGSTARLIAACRPDTPIIGLTPEEHVLHLLAFSRGVAPERTDKRFEDHLRRAENFVDAASLFNPGENVIITAGQPKHGRERTGTNVVKIYRK
jgi:pyruvate kinase